MAYKRKTRDEFEIQGYYAPEIGWECICTVDTRIEARTQLKDYNMNEPMYPHRIKKRRVKIEDVRQEVC